MHTPPTNCTLLEIILPNTKIQEDTASLTSGAKLTEVDQDMPVHARVTAGF